MRPAYLIPCDFCFTKIGNSSRHKILSILPTISSSVPQPIFREHAEERIHRIQTRTDHENSCLSSSKVEKSGHEIPTFSSHLAGLANRRGPIRSIRNILECRNRCFGNYGLEDPFQQPRVVALTRKTFDGRSALWIVSTPSLWLGEEFRAADRQLLLREHIYLTMILIKTQIPLGCTESRTVMQAPSMAAESNLVNIYKFQAIITSQATKRSTRCNYRAKTRLRTPVALVVACCLSQLGTESSALLMIRRRGEIGLGVAQWVVASSELHLSAFIAGRIVFACTGRGSRVISVLESVSRSG